MPTFPCSIRDAADALGVYRGTLGILVVTHQIATRPAPHNPATKLLDEPAYRRLAEFAQPFRRSLVTAN